MNHYILAGAIFLSVFYTVALAEMRSWTDSEGREITAALIGLTDEYAFLEQRPDKWGHIPIHDLDQDSQNFITKIPKARAYQLLRDGVMLSTQQEAYKIYNQTRKGSDFRYWGNEQEIINRIIQDHNLIDWDKYKSYGGKYHKWKYVKAELRIVAVDQFGKFIQNEETYDPFFEYSRGAFVPVTADNEPSFGPANPFFWIGLVLDFCITWGLGLAIPLILRFLWFKRPIDKKRASWIAGVVCSVWWMIFRILAIEGSGAVWLVVFFVAVAIMHRGYAKQGVDTKGQRDERRIGMGWLKKLKSMMMVLGMRIPLIAIVALEALAFLYVEMPFWLMISFGLCAFVGAMVVIVLVLSEGTVSKEGLKDELRIFLKVAVSWPLLFVIIMTTLFFLSGLPVISPLITGLIDFIGSVITFLEGAGGDY